MINIKGYHIRLCSFSNSPIEKSYDGYIVSPISVAGGLHNLVMLLHALKWDPSPNPS
jgi:hypothetical protein